MGWEKLACMPSSAHWATWLFAERLSSFPCCRAYRGSLTLCLSVCQWLPLVYPGEKNQYILGWSSCQLSNKAIVMPGSGVCILICFCSPVVYVQHFQLHLSVSAVSNKELNSNKEGRKRMCVCQSGCLAKLLSYFVFIIYLPLSHILAFFLFLTKIIMWVNE